MRRTWFLPNSGEPPFRNCELIKDDRRRLLNRLLPWRRATLRQEWYETFSRGVQRPGSKYNPFEPGKHDRFVPYDDSPEAMEAWVQRFLESNGRDTTL
jgi:hypothetical protein